MTEESMKMLQGLPCADRIMTGLLDYGQNRSSLEACLVRIARRRLSRAGLLDAVSSYDDGAEMELYGYFAHEGPQAYSRYNALLRELISFEHALDHRLTQGLI